MSECKEERGETGKEPLKESAVYIVSTPIGNLGDLSPRAISVLKSVDLILAEDTRHFGKLAKAFGINTRAKSYHDHNERSRTAELIQQIVDGLTVALVSDSGTPTISDPGYRLLTSCHENNISVFSIPGACAAVAALSVSGFPTDRFLFEGFLPVKPGKRAKALNNALENQTTTIFYESPHRIIKTLNHIAEKAPQRRVLVSREISKIHEEHLRGSAEEVLAELSSRPSVKGEIVLIIDAGEKRGKEQGQD
ncbi:16S rRNA (cytidine(1402)-2'-O)-methyltransferase [bacterium J17]|nr:16S rRNA (cytidine(1402)-2'-O)-methyltransferase [bacterium J17]